MRYHKGFSFLGFFLLLMLTNSSMAQFIVSGNVYDSSKVVPVKNVIVKSSFGSTTKTDSLGHYDIMVREEDSLTFIYNNKSTLKFSVKQIQNLAQFDISLLVRVNEKYKILKEVRVYSNTYRQDSLENRIDNRDVFGYQKPGISTTTDSYSGGAGLDLDELINVFRFRRNRQLQSLQKRLEEEEQDKYIDYRFNKRLVKRITRLDSAELDTFMKIYRPDYLFTSTSSTVQFYQYILDASYQFKSEMLMQKKKEEQ
ncbi:hypothetical protein [Ferruginibacter albus]|uniref:hypothetical protein n=1 Tax=Ferruginibacter albus TaxID=2875540 RepID=UPI001CC54E79|nr:hypothetical protein [Ferruginibacter albus]UAY52165.1 hypothetical protein K9M53_00380 [Ferruginibacter albus]